MTATGSFGATPVARGCGTRQKGGIYIEVGVGPDGEPLESFLVDPPIPIASMNVSALGVTAVERKGLVHLIDVFGREHYPNVADAAEEIRHYGLSRRISGSFDFRLLTPGSRILCAHDRALVANVDQWYSWRCPKAIKTHNASDASPCIGVCWQDVEGGVETTPQRRDEDGKVIPDIWTTDRTVIRAMPSFSYKAARRPNTVVPEYRRAIWASFPISRLVVIAGNDHEKALERARKSGLPALVVDE